MVGGIGGLFPHTANRLMQLFEEYGDKLFVSTDEVGRSNSSALTNLTCYQALLLLGIPEDEREKFILQHDVEDMTIRELDQALKERNQTAPEKEQAQVTPLPNNPQDIKMEYLTVSDSILASVTVDYYGIPARVVFVRNRDGQREWLALLCTDLKISDEEVVRIYGMRWDIKVVGTTTNDLYDPPQV